ncbi:thioredoxin-dependent thiol peroxidase [Patescibacteria group bacterium]
MNTSLKENQKAPDFTLQDTNEASLKLSDFKGKWIVLYFYPRDNTPGCTIEAMDFSRLKKDFEKLNAVVLGISKDSCVSHQKFTEKKELTINLLSDPESEVQKLYYVWKPKKMMGREFLGTVRTTFLINPEGVIVKIWNKVKAKGHAEETLGVLEMM